jgi:prepilin-type N-terminal cleavage/methylation domain-containing protein
MMKRAFTLVELLVVIAMIAILTGAVGTSVSTARARAREMKATTEVKEMTNAILAYENFARSGEYSLEPMDADATVSTVGFILGKGQSSDADDRIPVLYNGSVGTDGVLRDPWGTPYRVKIEEGDVPSVSSEAASTMATGYMPPNFYRLSIGERNR